MNAAVEIDREEIAAQNAALEALEARERLAWTIDRFGASTLYTSSFGPGSGALLHLWSEIARELPVTFFDTGFLFPETIAYRDQLAARLGLELRIVRPAVDRESFLGRHGLRVYQERPDFCCSVNKVEPLERALAGAGAWVSGLRRDQGPTRAQTPVLLATIEGPLKVHPIADWSARDVYRYLDAHGLPEHPLFEQGYVSVGCAPCTRPIGPDEEERAGRWSGSSKTECGLHTALKPR